MGHETGFQWIPSHSGIMDSEAADHFAKMAHTSAQQLAVPFFAADSNRLVREVGNPSYLALCYLTTTFACMRVSIAYIQTSSWPSQAKENSPPSPSSWCFIYWAQSFLESSKFHPPTAQLAERTRRQRIWSWAVLFTLAKQPFWKALSSTLTRCLSPSARFLDNGVYQKRPKHPQELLSD